MHLTDDNLLVSIYFRLQNRVFHPSRNEAGSRKRWVFTSSLDLSGTTSLPLPHLSFPYRDTLCIERMQG